MMKYSEMPIFTAITFDSATNRRLMRIINNLDSFAEATACHPEPEERLHLTLNYRPFVYRIEPLIDRLSKINAEPFDLHLCELGVFKNKNTDVIWMGVDHDLDALVNLKETIDREFESMGYAEGPPHLCSAASDPVIYRPHITLAFAKDVKLIKRTKELLPADEDTVFTIDSFHIFREIKDEESIRFDLIHTFPLKAEIEKTYG